jgi:hypothetical protein
MVEPLLLAPTHHGRARLWTRRLHVPKGVRDLLGPLSWGRQSVGASALRCLPSLATCNQDQNGLTLAYGVHLVLNGLYINCYVDVLHCMMCSIDFDGNDNFQEFERTICVESTVIDISSTWFSVLSMYAIFFFFFNLFVYLYVYFIFIITRDTCLIWLRMIWNINRFRRNFKRQLNIYRS